MSTVEEKSLQKKFEIDSQRLVSFLENFNKNIVLGNYVDALIKEQWRLCRVTRVDQNAVVVEYFEERSYRVVS